MKFGVFQLRIATPSWYRRERSSEFRQKLKGFGGRLSSCKSLQWLAQEEYHRLGKAPANKFFLKVAPLPIRRVSYTRPIIYAPRPISEISSALQILLPSTRRLGSSEAGYSLSQSTSGYHQNISALIRNFLVSDTLSYHYSIF